MKKKEYIKPEMNAFQMETPAILAGSNIKIASKEDYRDLDGYIDEDGNIYAD